MPVDISSWPTKAQAQASLALSLSQINNLIKAKRLEVRLEKRDGRPPLGRVNPQDVARERELRQARETQAHVVPAGAVVSAKTALAVRRPDPAPMRFAFLASNPPLWMRYDQAAAFTGLGEFRLRELVARGRIKTERGPHGAVVLRRKDLARHAEED